MLIIPRFVMATCLRPIATQKLGPISLCQRAVKKKVVNVKKWLYKGHWPYLPDVRSAAFFAAGMFNFRSQLKLISLTKANLPQTQQLFLAKKFTFIKEYYIQRKCFHKNKIKFVAKVAQFCCLFACSFTQIDAISSHLIFDMLHKHYHMQNC